MQGNALRRLISYSKDQLALYQLYNSNRITTPLPEQYLCGPESKLINAVMSRIIMFAVRSIKDKRTYVSKCTTQ